MCLQIDVNTVKNLDKSLFLSDEIREVYKEIMQTVPHDHLELDNVSTGQTIRSKEGRKCFI